MIYIDLGCHNGDSIIDFYKGLFCDIDPTNITSIGIDPLSIYDKQKEEISKKYGTKFIKAVVSNYNGKATLSEHNNDISSSIRPEKHQYRNGKKYEVDCIDFSNFIKDYDDILLRMDIEGEEYNVLEKMIKDGSINKIKYLDVEFHGHRFIDGFRQSFRKRGADICEELKKLGIKYHKM